MVVRVTVTLLEETLAQLDTIARAENVTRSDIVREATASYVTQHTAAAQSTARIQAVEDGICWLEDVAAQSTGEHGLSTLDVLRDLRGESPVDEAPLPPINRSDRRP